VAIAAAQYSPSGCSSLLDSSLALPTTAAKTLFVPVIGHVIFNGVQILVRGLEVAI